MKCDNDISFGLQRQDLYEKRIKRYLLQELNFSLVRSMVGWEKQLYFCHTLQRLNKWQHIKEALSAAGIPPRIVNTLTLSGHQIPLDQRPL